MAGHSAFSNIKHRKERVDAKRGKLWSKLSKALILAAKSGGGDPNANIKLRYAVDAARAASMPKDTIARCIKKGTGELEGNNLEEILYEGYGPGGVAVLCDVLTDNRNRTAGEVRKIFEVNGGKLGASGCVAWMFERKGLFLFPADQTSEDALVELSLEAGADDVKRAGDKFELTCDPTVFHTVNEAVEAAGLKPELAEISRLPSSTVDLDVDAGRQVLKLLEALDDHDDIQSVSANYNLPDEALALLTAE